MDVWWVGHEGIESRSVGDLGGLLERPDGFVWVDVPTFDDGARSVLENVFGFHHLALRDCANRSIVPKIHAYADHLFLILHSPEPGDTGQVHLLELDQFIGVHYLVTVHGPVGEGVDHEQTLRETRAIVKRIQAGRFHPRTPAALSHAIVSAFASSMEDLLSRIAIDVADVERRVMRGDRRDDPELVLEDMFRLRHKLLTLRTMAAGSREIPARMASLGRFLPGEDALLVEDLVDRFERVRGMCDGEREFLQGLVDYYQSRVATKMNIAMERLALIAALMMPLTAVAAVYGMNIIVPTETNVAHVAGVVVAMLVVAGLMLRWAKRHGWW